MKWALQTVGVTLGLTLMLVAMLVLLTACQPGRTLPIAEHAEASPITPQSLDLAAFESAVDALGPDRAATFVTREGGGTVLAYYPGQGRTDAERLRYLCTRNPALGLGECGD